MFSCARFTGVQQSDIISLHVPLMPETYHIIGKESIRTRGARAFYGADKLFRDDEEGSNHHQRLPWRSHRCCRRELLKFVVHLKEM